MMGICSLFGLSRGLSLSAEVVRMLNGWERRESQRRVSSDCFAGWVPFGASALRTKRRRRCWGRGFRQRYMAQSAGQVGLFGSLGAPKGAPKARPKWS